MLNNQKGFTLIELMVVVVIIGILAAIALPNFLSMQDRAKESEVKSNTHTVQLQVEDYKTNSAINPGGVKPAAFNTAPLAATATPLGVARGNAQVPGNLKNPFNIANVGALAINSYNDDATAVAVFDVGRPTVAGGGQVEYHDGALAAAPVAYVILGNGKPNAAGAANYISRLAEGQ